MISVAIASFNGAEHIRRQIESILPQLSVGDEIVVSDDGSTDGTVGILNNLSTESPNAGIRILQGPRTGVLGNFENAVRACRGDYIFLADQDDEWLPSKVAKVMAAFANTKCPIVMHDCKVVNEDGSEIYASLFKKRGVRHGLLKNIIKGSFLGCAMAFRRELLEKALPFKGGKWSNLHDTWLGLIGERNGGFFFLDEVLMNYYRYPTSVTSQFLKPFPFWRQILKRVLIIWNLYGI